MTSLDAPQTPKVDQSAEAQASSAFTESYDSMAESSQTQEFDKDAIDQINKMFGSSDELLNNDNLNNSMNGEIQEEGNQENFDSGELDEAMEGLMIQPDDQAAEQLEDLDGTQEHSDHDSTENLNPGRDSEEEREIPQEETEDGMSDQELLDGLQGDNGAPMQPGSEDQYNSNVDRWSDPEDTPTDPNYMQPRGSEEDTLPRVPQEPNDLIIPPIEYEA